MVLQRMHIRACLLVSALVGVFTINVHIFCMESFCVSQKPDISAYPRYNIAEPQGLTDCIAQDWERQRLEKLIQLNPAKNVIKVVSAESSSAQFSLICNPERANRPMPRLQRQDFGQLCRRRRTILSGLSEQEITTVSKLLMSRGAVRQDETGKYHWTLGRKPSWDDFCHEDKQQLEALWGKTGPEANPLQTNFAYKNQIFALLQSKSSGHSYCLLANIYPLCVHHLLLISPEADKPQYIATELELFDLLSLQRYFAQQQSLMQINFNSNNAGSTMGGASLSVWHCQIADLMIGDPSRFTVKTIRDLGSVVVGEYAHLKTTHRLFIGRDQGAVSHAAFAYISLLNEANNAYNMSLFFDRDNNFRVLLTIRGCWLDKSVSLAPQHQGVPAFAEVAGSLIFTDTTEYDTVVAPLDKGEPGQVREFVHALQRACSQDAAIVEGFDQAFMHKYQEGLLRT